MLPTINERMRIKFERIKGHIHLDIRVVREGGTILDIINFVYDTGAYITVINRERYEELNLDRLPRTEVTMGGYVGIASGYVFQIPGLIIGQRLLTGVWAFSPKSKDIQQNLLGDNVIEYFMPFQDNHNDYLYFPDNPTPEPYIYPGTNFSLACSQALYVDDALAKIKFDYI